MRPSGKNAKPQGLVRPLATSVSATALGSAADGAAAAGVAADEDVAAATALPFDAPQAVSRADTATAPNTSLHQSRPATLFAAFDLLTIVYVNNCAERGFLT